MIKGEHESEQPFTVAKWLNNLMQWVFIMMFFNFFPRIHLVNGLLKFG